MKEKGEKAMKTIKPIYRTIIKDKQTNRQTIEYYDNPEEQEERAEYLKKITDIDTIQQQKIDIEEIKNETRNKTLKTIMDYLKTKETPLDYIEFLQWIASGKKVEPKKTEEKTRKENQSLRKQLEQYLMLRRIELKHMQRHRINKAPKEEREQIAGHTRERIREIRLIQKILLNNEFEKRIKGKKEWNQKRTQELIQEYIQRRLKKEQITHGNMEEDLNQWKMIDIGQRVMKRWPKEFT